MLLHPLTGVTSFMPNIEVPHGYGKIGSNYERKHNVAEIHSNPHETWILVACMYLCTGYYNQPDARLGGESQSIGGAGA